MTEENRDMGSAVSDIDKLNAKLRLWERSLVRRLNTNLVQARKSIAPHIGITADTIENFRSLRNKIVPHSLMDRVHAGLMSALELEAKNIDREIAHHRRFGSRHSDAALASAEAALVSARELLTINKEP